MIRQWLPPLCLIALVAAVWAIPPGPQCPNSPWDGGPAIARVSDDCVYWYQFDTYLSDLSLNLGSSGQGSAADESPLGEFYRDRYRLVSEFGLENAAFATLALDTALYRAAASRGHVPPDSEVMAMMGQERERIGGLLLMMRLHELAKASDLVAFRSLIESPPVRRLLPVQGEEHLLLLFEQAKEMDFSSMKAGLEIHAALGESFGADRYWTEAYVVHARRLLAIEALRSTMAGPETDWSSVIDWLDFREETWSGADISLSDAAPNTLNLEDVRSFMNAILALERDFLDFEPLPFENSPDDSANPDAEPDR